MKRASENGSKNSRIYLSSKKKCKIHISPTLKCTEYSDHIWKFSFFYIKLQLSFFFLISLIAIYSTIHTSSVIWNSIWWSLFFINQNLMINFSDLFVCSSFYSNNLVISIQFIAKIKWLKIEKFLKPTHQ